MPASGKADARKQFRVQCRAAETQRLGLPDDAERDFPVARCLRPVKPLSGNQPGLSLQARLRLDGDRAAPRKAAVGVTLLDGTRQRLGLVALRVAAPADAGDPQLVGGAWKRLQLRRVTERAGVDDHVFQARASG